MFDLAYITTSIRPCKFSSACELVVLEGSLVDESMMPGIGSLSMHETLTEGSMIDVAIGKLYMSDAGEIFMIDLVMDFGLNITIPFLIVLDSKLKRKERLVLNFHSIEY